MRRLPAVRIGTLIQRLIWSLGMIPVRFALQCYLVSWIVPHFFGGRFAGGFGQLLLFTLGLSFSLFVLSFYWLPLHLVKRRFVAATDPELADLKELEKRRKGQKEAEDILAGVLPTRTVLNATKTTPSFLARAALSFWIMSCLMPGLFVVRTPLVWLESCVVFTLVDTAFNTIVPLLLFSNVRAKESNVGVNEEGNDKGAVKTMDDLLEQKSLILGRHDLEIQAAPSAKAYYERGKAQLTVNEPIAAIDDFDKSISLDDRFAPAYESRAGSYEKLGLLTLARKDLLKARLLFAEQDDPEALQRIVDRLQELGSKSRSPEALKSGREVATNMAFLFDPKKSKDIDNIRLDNIKSDLASNIQTAGIYQRQAELLYSKGDYASALESCNKALELNKGFGDAYRTRGKVLVQLARLEEGLDDFAKAIELNPQDGDAYEERARVNLIAFADYEAVIRDCTEALNFSKSFQFKLLRANANFELRRFEEAVGDLDEFIAAWEGFIRFWDAVPLPSFGHIADGLRKQLIEAYQKRIMAYEGLGNVDKAAQDLARLDKVTKKLHKRSGKKS